MSTALIIVIVLLLALALFLYRFFTNPFFTGRVLRFVLHLRYKVTLDGFDRVMEADTFLIMPNHPAYIDPIILFSEMYSRGRKVSPMTDEKFFRNPAFRQVLSLGDAVMVPDLLKNRSAAAVNQASHLVQIAVNALSEGRNLVFYPSGHVTLDGVESIGNRRMAFETMQAIANSYSSNPLNPLNSSNPLNPSNSSNLRRVRVFMLRTRGLETSHWSKSRKVLLHSPNRQSHRLVDLLSRRLVTLHFEDMTDALLSWVQTYDKHDFNRQLEDWYNR